MNGSDTESMASLDYIETPLKQEKKEDVKSESGTGVEGGVGGKQPVNSSAPQPEEGS